MTLWDSGDVTANGIRLHYTRTGGAKPSVVLAHGFSDNGLCWTPVAQALEADYDVVMLDARGHGRSDAPEEGYGPAAHAADLAGAIAALGLTRPAVLGHSMGAASTLVLAGTEPAVPRAILLEDPPAWWMTSPQDAPPPADRGAGMRAWIAGLQGKTREGLIADQRAAAPGWSEAELGPWAEAKLQLSPQVLADRAGAPPVPWPAILGRITCPVLLITADPARGAIVTEESAAALQALVPQARVAHIPEAGHSVRRDRLTPYLEAVCAFLRETTDA